MTHEAMANPVPLPTCVNWELTYACQLRCTHCYTESGRGPSRKLPRDALLRIAEILGGMGLESVLLVGGEPLLIPEIFEIGEVLRASGTRASLYTNGMNVSRALAERIAGTFPEVHVSLDGATADVHDTIRGRTGAFAQAAHALSLFDEQAAARANGDRPGFRFGVDVVVVRRNWHQLDRLCLAVPLAYPNVSFLLLGAALPAGLAGADDYVENELITEAQLASLDDPAVFARLRALVPERVELEVSSNVRWRRPEDIGAIEVEADGGVRLYYKGTALGNILVDDPKALFREATRRATSPFVRDQMAQVTSTAGWAAALRRIEEHFTPGRAAVRLRRSR